MRNWVKQAERKEGKRRTAWRTDEREELARLRRENQTLRMEREILKKAAAFFAGRPASRRRDLLADRGGEGQLSVSLMCRALGVNRTSFHDWERRAPSDRALSDAWLTEKIKQIHAASNGTYGPRGFTPSCASSTGSASGVSASSG